MTATEGVAAGEVLKVGFGSAEGKEEKLNEAVNAAIATAKTTTIDVRDGKAFSNDVVGHYVWRIGWTPDSTELLMNRANRRQQIVRGFGNRRQSRHATRNIAPRDPGKRGA